MKGGREWAWAEAGWGRRVGRGRDAKTCGERRQFTISYSTAGIGEEGGQERD